ncbi:MAG: lactate utilization protein [Bryobacteraceae bacterium]|nr:lactate utilization protein [Bryobacteraceae bacterium]
MSRDHILHRIRTALGRTSTSAAAPPPAAHLELRPVPFEQRLEQFRSAVQALAGYVHSKSDARSTVEQILDGRSAVCADAPLLREWNIDTIAGVIPFTRENAATADVGITLAEYALADTGSLAVFASAAQPRLASLLPPCHVALVRRENLLTGLDELLGLHPQPLDGASSLVLITGPSRTADIEMILVRGVHGPGELHVILV